MVLIKARQDRFYLGVLQSLDHKSELLTAERFLNFVDGFGANCFGLKAFDDEGARLLVDVTADYYKQVCMLPEPP